MDNTTTFADLFKRFQESPCYKCSMIASLHAHTQDEAAEFKFGCDGVALEECREAHIERLVGPPGTQGEPGILG